MTKSLARHRNISEVRRLIIVQFLKLDKCPLRHLQKIIWCEPVKITRIFILTIALSIRKVFVAFKSLELI